jgi:hypothetical protein
LIPFHAPAHYTSGSIECIEAIEAQLTPEEYRGFLKGNVAKYLWREKMKGGTQSLEKAQWYLDRLIALEQTKDDELRFGSASKMRAALALRNNVIDGHLAMPLAAISASGLI